MLIRDITISDIMAGRNWRLLGPAALWLDDPTEEWGPIEECSHFDLADFVVYSGLILYPSGRSNAIVQIKEVRAMDYGGDYCEFVNRAWRQVGLVANPNAEVGRDYIASPL